MRWSALLLACLGRPAWTQVDPPTAAGQTRPINGSVAVSTSGPRIERMLIQRKNVFDLSAPGEDWWPFRLADRIHILTRENVVGREILIRPDEPWDPFKALESERNLRNIGFIRRAEVTRKGTDLRVLTQDSWTLAPQLNVGTEGGQNYLIFGVQEGNLLGMGKSVGAVHSQVGSDIRNEARYKDPRLLGSWFQMTDLYSTTKFGDEYGVLLNRPFYALDTDYAARLSWARVIEDEILYQDANQTSEFVQSFRSVMATGGARINRDPVFVQRGQGGVYYARSRFDSTPDTVGPLPANRTLAGPVADYSWVYERYIKETNINNMFRVEDFNLGNEFSVLGGPMLRSWGSDRDRWIFNALDQQGLQLEPGRFLLGQVGAQGRFAGGSLENTVAYANVNLFWKSEWPWSQTWVSHLEGNTTRHLDGEDQILLGGNTGLRGYKNYSFTGNRSVLLNLEDRLFFDYDILHLLYVGGVAFFDTGAIGPAGIYIAPHDYKSDVGFGLRFSPSRSTSGGVFRMDLAYALNGGPGGSRWVVSIRGSQAFSIFNSSSRSALRSPDATLNEGFGSSRLSPR